MQQQASELPRVTTRSSSQKAFYWDQFSSKQNSLKCSWKQSFFHPVSSPVLPTWPRVEPDKMISVWFYETKRFTSALASSCPTRRPAHSTFRAPRLPINVVGCTWIPSSMSWTWRLRDGQSSVSPRLCSAEKKTRKAETETVELNTSLLYTRNKKLLGTPGIAARSKDAATRGSWPYY